MERRRILIVDNNDELRAVLERSLREMGHEVVAIGDRAAALERDDLDEFDLVISDLTDDAEGGVQLVSEIKRKRLMIPIVVSSNQTQQPGIVKAFKIGASNYLRVPYNKEELQGIVEKTLSYKLRFIDDIKVLPYVHEKIDFELPSDLSLMNGVLQYLTERVSKLGLIKPERSNLFVALDEAFVNAVKHGNRNDPTKLVRITAELSPKEARFTIEDEGAGFNVADIPDPRDPENLFRSSGRGVLLIYNIMDEVEYNDRGNRLTMVKRPEETFEKQLIDKINEDEQSRNGDS